MILRKTVGIPIDGYSRQQWEDLLDNGTRSMDTRAERSDSTGSSDRFDWQRFREGVTTMTTPLSSSPPDYVQDHRKLSPPGSPGRVNKDVWTRPVGVINLYNFPAQGTHPSGVKVHT